MTIGFSCEHCGKRVEAPDKVGGKRGRCPYCKQACYVPSPVAEEDLYDFAPEDEAQAARAAAERERVLQQDPGLLSDSANASSPSIPLEHKENVSAEDVSHHVVNYCLDMAASNLERSAGHIDKLRTSRAAAVQAVDDFLSGKTIEPALDQIPGKILHGFLQQLRKELTMPSPN